MNFGDLDNLGWYFNWIFRKVSNFFDKKLYFRLSLICSIQNFAIKSTFNLLNALRGSKKLIEEKNRIEFKIEVYSTNFNSKPTGKVNFLHEC